MASSATIISNEGVNENGKRRRVIANVAFTAEAHSNGYAIDKTALFGFQASLESLVILDAGAASSDLWKYDAANSTVRKYAEGAAIYAEVTSNLTETIQVQAIGF